MAGTSPGFTGGDGAEPTSPQTPPRVPPQAAPHDAPLGAAQGAGQAAPSPLPVREGRPGSDGEHALQVRLGTEKRADRFYDEQMLDHLNERMREFVARQEWFFLATADRHGECDNSFRAGPPGFLRVLDPKSLVYPEYRGNGVHASLGNIAENPHAALLLVDFDKARIGLHINGRARIIPDAEMRALHPDLPVDPVPGRRAELWVRVEVEEAYIHCAKHIPRLVRAGSHRSSDWGTDDVKRKGGDYFGAAREAQARRRAAAQAQSAPASSPAGRGGAAPDRTPPEVPVPPADPAAWRAEAQRALAEAERRRRANRSEAGSDHGGGWFHRG